MTIHKMKLPEKVAAIYYKKADLSFMIISANYTKDERHLIEVVKKSVTSEGTIYTK
jgi:hypothetical protein